MKTIYLGLTAALLISSASLNAQEVQASTPALSQEQPATPKATSWTDKISILGDFRYRDDLTIEKGKPDRNRNRIRARYGIKADPFDSLTSVFQLATNYNDPISTNQDLGDGFSGKPVRIDLAYFDWHPTCKYGKGLHVYGGKMKNPFYDPGKSQLLWDSDLNPEGLSLTYTKSIGGFEFTANTGTFWVVERSLQHDSWLLGYQGVARYNFMDEGKLYAKTALGYFYYSSLQGYPTIYDATKGFGNSTDASKNYLYKFRELEIAGEAGGKIKKIPVNVFGDFVKNTAKGVSQDKGWLIGFSAGEAVNPWTWNIRYNYRKLESDAVVGALTYSDFIGGGTNGKGHEIGAELAVAKNVKFGVNWLNNNKNLAAPSDYNRVMFDFSFKI
jgi:hypothetical protein